jgi:hypothetical protein
MSRFIATAVATIALCAAPAATAETTQVLELVANQTVLSAYNGHVVWNELDAQTGHWFLRHWHAGTSARLPVAPRSVQFDIDVGPASNGIPVAVYSRCDQEPAPPSGVALSPDWMAAEGCDIYSVSLVSGKERRVRRVSTIRGSETTPSIWRNRIAFARRPAGRRSARLYVRLRRRAVRLSGGTVPRSCDGCEPRPYAGPDALDLQKRSLSYLWRMRNGNAIGVAAWELRGLRLTSRRSWLIDAGYVGATCDFSFPLSPNSVGRRVIYAERSGGCATTRTRFTSFRRRSRTWRTAKPSGGLAYALSHDGDWLYWLRGKRPEPETGPSFDACRAVVCQIVRTRDLAFGDARRKKVAPPTL